jgi:hypothetical protein
MAYQSVMSFGTERSEPQRPPSFLMEDILRKENFAQNPIIAPVRPVPTCPPWIWSQPPLTLVQPYQGTIGYNTGSSIFC